MRNVPFVFFLASLAYPGPTTAAAQYAELGLTPPGPSQCKAEDPRIEVLLLGSYHMANPGQDVFNLESDDVLAERRQGELEWLVERLSAFRPTHVAVEAPFGDTATVARYHAYLTDDTELLRNEREQIGFRLARLMSHETIHPIDVRMGLDQSALGPIIGRSPEHQRRMGEFQQVGARVVALMGGWLQEGSIADMLYEMNRPEILQLSHELYLRYFLPIVEDDNYAGADLVATWYHRNLRILSNLHKISGGTNERILVVYGQGHIPILTDLIVHSPYFCRVDPLPFLRSNAG